MKQSVVKRMLPVALAMLEDPGLKLQKDGVLPAGFRNHVSAMGAAMIISNFKAVVVFYADDGDGNKEAPRSEVLRAVHAIATADFTQDGFSYRLMTPAEITESILPIDTAQMGTLKESYINASIALKQAMSAYRQV